MNGEFQPEDHNGVQSASLPTLFLPNEAEIIPNDIPSSIFTTANADNYATLGDITAAGSPPLGTTAHNPFLRDPDEPSVVTETDRVPADSSPTFTDEKEETSKAAGTITEDEINEVSDSTGPKATIAVGKAPLAVSEPFPEQRVSLPRPMAAAAPPGDRHLRVPRPTMAATPPRDYRVTRVYQTPPHASLPPYCLRAMRNTPVAPLPRPHPSKVPTPSSSAASPAGARQRRFTPEGMSAPKTRAGADVTMESPNRFSEDFDSTDVIDDITAANTFTNARNSGRLPMRAKTPRTGQYSFYLDSPDVASPASHAFNDGGREDAGCGIYSSYLDSPDVKSYNGRYSCADSERWAEASPNASYLDKHFENASSYVCFSPDVEEEIKWDPSVTISETQSWEAASYAHFLDSPDNYSTNNNSPDNYSAGYNTPRQRSNRGPPPRNAIVPFQRSPAPAHYFDCASSPLLAANMLNFRLVPEFMQAATRRRDPTMHLGSEDPRFENLFASSMLKTQPPTRTDEVFPVDLSALRDDISCRDGVVSIPSRRDDGGPPVSMRDAARNEQQRHQTSRESQEQRQEEQPQQQMRRQEHQPSRQSLRQHPQPCQSSPQPSSQRSQEPRQPPPQEPHPTTHQRQRQQIQKPKPESELVTQTKSYKSPTSQLQPRPESKPQPQPPGTPEGDLEKSGLSATHELALPPSPPPRLVPKRGASFQKPLPESADVSNCIDERGYDNQAVALTTRSGGSDRGGDIRPTSIPQVLVGGEAASIVQAEGFRTLHGIGSRVRIESFDVEVQQEGKPEFGSESVAAR